MTGAAVPEISVVVAASNAAGSVAACLQSLERQLGLHTGEIIVVDNSTDGTSEQIAGAFPLVRHLRAAPSAWVPELWSEGIQHCRGTIVALTTAHCVPAADWLERISVAHEQPHAAIGGAIAKATPSTLTDWAIYFCRYSAHRPAMARAEVDDIAGDNASYKHEILRRYADVYASGFWEPLIHARMRADGHTLLREPGIVVAYDTSLGLLGFVRQRFHHGWIFTRLQRRAHPQRLARAAAAPFVPLLMAARIARRLRQAPAERRQFVRALPLVFLFLGAWCLGEMVGYLDPRRPAISADGVSLPNASSAC